MSAPAQPTAPGAGPVVLAVDIGGTKMAAATVDGSGRLSAPSSCSTPASVDPEVVFGALETLVRGVLAGSSLRPVACGVGCGGPMHAGGNSVSPLNIRAWRDFPLRARLAAIVGLPAAVDNDAKALALGEGWVGAAAGYDDYLAMVVSTGVGGGIVLDGRLLNGRLGDTGHIGHVVVVPDGRHCPCGSRGCLEAEASGTALEALTGQPARLAPPEWVERTGMLVGRAISSVAVLLDLSLAVVSGSVALGFGEPFFAAAQAQMDQLCRIEFARRAGVV